MKIHTLRNNISYLLDLKSNERPFIFIEGKGIDVGE